ncbi:FkbM family methyltransferase [bacterium]|nr:FkbM family methyltransferase [bacterium]
MREFNAERQSSVLFDYWTDDIDWFIVGGTADSNEAQVVHDEYPNVNCIGFEPNPEFVNKQNMELQFPGKVYPYALWNENTELSLATPKKATARSSSVCRPYPSPDMGNHQEGTEYKVQSRTLDSLSEEFGPFDGAVLWIDIEYAERKCLEGAKNLLTMGAIKIINLETFCHLYLPEVNRTLTEYGFMLHRIYNIGKDTRTDGQDVIYVLEK